MRNSRFRAELRTRLDEVSAIESSHPYGFFTPPFQGWISGGTGLKPWAPRELMPHRLEKYLERKQRQLLNKNEPTGTFSCAADFR